MSATSTSPTTDSLSRVSSPAHSDTMATDSQMPDAPPGPTVGELPPPSVVEQWTEAQLFEFVRKQGILRNDKNRATFQNAEINGSAFLNDGDVRDYWLRDVQLPAGPSGNLARLAQMIKNMGKEESRVQSPPQPRTDPVTVEMLENLHRLLWGREEHLLRTVFCDFQYPAWNADTNPHINSEGTWTALKLTLGRITSMPYDLPCGADELLVRDAYREMYDILLKAQEDRKKHLDEHRRIPNRKKIILILGQPGIGKTWFLSYVLVRRLLEGKPTIFQAGEDFGGDRGFGAGNNYLIDKDGVGTMAVPPTILELKNHDIWVLADRTPFGIPRKFASHNWLVVVTTSPREANYHHIVKECSPDMFYFPTWDREEVGAAAALKGLSQKMWDKLFTLFDLYGPIPRLLFETLLPPDEYRTGMVEDGTAEVDDRLKARIANYDMRLDKLIQKAVTLGPDVLHSTEYGVNFSHSVFTMQLCKMERYKYISLVAVFGFATADIGRRIGEATIAKSLKDGQRFYNILLGQGQTKSSAGWIFEARMHQIFQRGGSFVATKQDRSKDITIDINPESCKDFSKVSELGSLLREKAGSRSIHPANIGGYFKPQHGNLPSVDSFAISECATTKKPLLVLFQMTVSTEHPVKAEGLARIWAEIPQALKNTKPILVFVVPTDVADAFHLKRQKISDSANKTSASENSASRSSARTTSAGRSSASKTSASNPTDFDEWEQYVLAFSNKELWENIMPV